MVANLYGRGELGDRDIAGRREWRLSNGVGGFAAGTASGELSRPQHGLLFAGLDPDQPATLLLAKLAVLIDVDGREHPLDTNAWASGVWSPEGYRHLEAFGIDGGVPVWRWAVAGARLESRVWMERGENTTFVQWRVRSAPAPVRLRALALVNHRGESEAAGHGVWTARVDPVAHGMRIEAFEGALPLWLLAPGAEMRPRQDWHREFGLRLAGVDRERAREDHLLAAEIVASLSPGEDLTIVASTRRDTGAGPAGRLAVASALSRRRAHERSLVDAWRRAQPSASRHAPDWIESLVIAADRALVESPGTPPRPWPWLAPRTGAGPDATREALMTLPGLMLMTGRPERAREVLERFVAMLDDGLLPLGPVARDGERVEGTAEATLWLVLAVRAYFEQTIDAAFLGEVYPALEAALESLAQGTRGGIAADPSDGLLHAGAEGAIATWMDADLVAAGLPPRHGKAVETNALWFNAHLALAACASRLRVQPERWKRRAERIEQGFARFWNDETECLFDVLDGPFGADASVRPNQILALSLPDSPLAVAQRRAVLARCERDLITSYGMRSLSSRDPRYHGAEIDAPADDPATRVLGSAWTWLLPHAALAHAAVRGDRAVAHDRLGMLELLMRSAGALVLPERTTGDPPHAPRGSLDRALPIAEALRAWHLLTGVRRDLRRRELRPSGVRAKASAGDLVRA